MGAYIRLPRGREGSQSLAWVPAFAGKTEGVVSLANARAHYLLGFRFCGKDGLVGYGSSPENLIAFAPVIGPTFALSLT
jgi:hypothetical protein